MSIVDVTPAVVNVSSLTESVISGEMAASTAAGSAALSGVVPMAASADDVAIGFNLPPATCFRKSRYHRWQIIDARVTVANEQHLQGLAFTRLYGVGEQDRQQ